MKTRREFFAGAIAVAASWGFRQDQHADQVRELRNRHLELPVQGATKRDLRESFSETRGSTHNHEAVDILAQRNTPVLAVEDGTIARLFDSKRGGTTVYQFDPAGRYAYYYAHLERYADGVHERDHVKRGQVLGYVGTSGNAPPDTPHLHFAIFRLTEAKQWWHGSPIDPYDVLK
jgi:murein DD-endopeptidase MepM/ murein hydrolase activator NlpD